MSRVSKTVRQQVRQRAGGRCEYCHKPEGYSPYSHHVDHILPTARHEGSPELHNLAWSCFDCNTSKSGEISGYDDGELTPLYNPRSQSWNDHFQWDGAVIRAITAIGRVTVRLLQMNAPERIEFRQQMMDDGLW